MTIRRTTICLLLAFLLTGCKTLSPPEWSKSWLGPDEPKLTESQYSKPVRLAVVWSPAVLNSPNKKPTRGFGGRMYFYDAANKAVSVEGQLVVYGYNDSKPGADGKTPDRKYAFTPEQFTQHYSPTDLGASYSVWVPWDEVGADQVEISLVPIFTATSGQLVVGQSSKNLLPGPTTVNTPTRFEQFTVPASQMAQQHHATGFGVQQASFQQPPNWPQQQGARSFEETSIRVPDTLAQRMAQAGPQPSIAALNNEARQPMSPAAGMAGPPGPAPATTASWSRAPAAALPQTSPTNQPLARFVRPARPAPSSPGLPPTAGPPPSQPFPAAQPFSLPASRLPGL
jgi:hypothetical protein